MLRPQSLGLTKNIPTPSARQKNALSVAAKSNEFKKIFLLAKLDWYCLHTGPSYDGIGVGELVGALMGMTLIALASAALADPARLPTSPRCGAAASSHHCPADASTVIVPPPRSQWPLRRCAAKPLAVIAPMRHRSTAASAAAAIEPAAARSRVRHQAATSAVVRCHVRC